MAPRPMFKRIVASLALLLAVGAGTCGSSWFAHTDDASPVASSSV